MTPPLLMGHTIFSTVIPEGRADLKLAAMVMNVEASILFSNPRKRREMMAVTFGELLEQAEKFVAAAMKGAFMKEAMKPKILKKSEMMDDDGNYSLEMQSVALVTSQINALRHMTYPQVMEEMRRLGVMYPPVAAVAAPVGGAPPSGGGGGH